MELVGSDRLESAQVQGLTIFGIVASSDGTTKYTPWASLDGTFGCGCPAATHVPCSHVVAVLASVGLKELVKFILQRVVQE